MTMDIDSGRHSGSIWGEECGGGGGAAGHTGLSRGRGGRSKVCRSGAGGPGAAADIPPSLR